MKKGDSYRMSALKEIQGIPGYYIDVEKGEAWSFQKRGLNKEKTWFKLSVHKRNYQTFESFIAVVNGKRKDVSLGRAVFAVTHNLPYNHPSLSAFVFYWEKKQVEVRTKYEVQIEGQKKWRSDKYSRLRRMEELERVMQVLPLVKKAYDGNPNPLLLYINQKTDYYLAVLNGKFYQQSMEKAKIGLELAKDRLIHLIDDCNGRILDVDGWIIRTAYHQVNKLYAKGSKHIDITKLRFL